MDVKKLYEAALASVSGQTLVITEERGGIYAEAAGALAAVFEDIGYSSDLLTVHMPLLSYDENQDIFSISVSDEFEICNGFFFKCISFSVSSLTLICGIANRGLDEDGKLMLFHCAQNFHTDYENPSVTETIHGILQVGSVQLFLGGEQNTNGAFEYHLEEKGDIPAAELVSGFFSLFSIPMFIKEEALPIRLSYISAVFEESSTGEDELPNDCFSLKAAVDLTPKNVYGNDTAAVGSLAIGGKFRIDSLTFCFEKFGCDKALSVGGRVRVLSMPPLNFMARYDGRGGSYLLGVNGQGNPAFGFAQIEELTGTPVQEIFPPEVAAAQGLTAPVC